MINLLLFNIINVMFYFFKKIVELKSSVTYSTVPFFTRSQWADRLPEFE